MPLKYFLHPECTWRLDRGSAVCVVRRGSQEHSWKQFFVTASAEAACVYIDQITDQHMLPDESLNALTLAP